MHTNEDLGVGDMDMSGDDSRCDVMTADKNEVIVNKMFVCVFRYFCVQMFSS